MQAVRGKLYLTGAFSLAGTSVVTGYLLSEKLSGFTITALSMGFVLAGLLPIYAKSTLQTIRLLTRGDWLMIVSQAFFGIFLFRMFLLFGVRLTSTAEAGILTGAMPAITAGMAYFLLKERLSAFTAAGIALTVIGVALLQGGNLLSLRFSGGHLVGNLLILCAAASESAFNIISRKHKLRENDNASVPIHPMVQTLLLAAVALCLSLVPALLERPFPALATLGWPDIAALIWYGIVITAVAFGFFYAGAKRCDAYTIAAFSGMMPLTAMLLSMLVIGERIGWLQWVGGAMIVTSIFLIGRQNGRKPC